MSKNQGGQHRYTFGDVIGYLSNLNGTVDHFHSIRGRADVGRVSDNPNAPTQAEDLQSRITQPRTRPQSFGQPKTNPLITTSNWTKLLLWSLLFSLSSHRIASWTSYRCFLPPWTQYVSPPLPPVLATTCKYISTVWPNTDLCYYFVRSIF
jgi:hypothetical protein